MSDKARIEVQAELLVNVRFEMEVGQETSLSETNKRAREAAERVAMNVIGSRGDTIGASLQRVTSFTTKLI